MNTPSFAIPFTISILGGSQHSLAFAQALAKESRGHNIKYRIRTANPVALAFTERGHLLHCREEAQAIPADIRTLADRVYPSRHDMTDVWWTLSGSNAFVVLAGGLADFRELLPYLAQTRNGNGPVPVALVGVLEAEDAQLTSLCSQNPGVFECFTFSGLLYPLTLPIMLDFFNVPKSPATVS